MDIHLKLRDSWVIPLLVGVITATIIVTLYCFSPDIFSVDTQDNVSNIDFDVKIADMTAQVSYSPENLFPSIQTNTSKEDFIVNFTDMATQFAFAYLAIVLTLFTMFQALMSNISAKTIYYAVFKIYKDNMAITLVLCVSLLVFCLISKAVLLYEIDWLNICILFIESMGMVVIATISLRQLLAMLKVSVPGASKNNQS